MLICSITGMAAEMLSSKSSVCRLKDVEKEKKELVKSLGKQYKAKVTAEHWIDGNDYFILHRDGRFARADMDGNLIVYTDQHGSKASFFYACEYRDNGPGNQYYLLRRFLSENCIIWNVGTLDDRIPCNLNVSKVENVNGRTYIYHNCILNKKLNVPSYYLYTADGSLVNTVPGYDFKFVDGDGKGRQIIDDSKIPFVFNWPHMQGLAYARISDKPVKYAIFCPGKGRVKEADYAVGRICMTLHSPDGQPISVSRDVRTNRHYDNKGALVGNDTVMSIFFPKPVDVMRIDSDDILAQGVSNIQLVSNSSVFYYTIKEDAGTPDEKRYVGLVDMADTTRNVPALFADVAWNREHNACLVQSSIFEPFEPYSSEKTYAKNMPSEQEREIINYSGRKYVLAKTENVADSIANLEADDVAIVRAAYISTLGSVLEWMDNHIIRTDRHLETRFWSYVPETRLGNIGGHIVSWFADAYPRYKAYCVALSAYYDDPELNANLRNMLADAEVHEEEALDAYADFNDWRNKKNAEVREQNRKYRERRERMERALEKAKRIDEFQSALATAQAIVREGEARQATKSHVSAGKVSEIGTGSSGATSSPGADNSDRKAFLKGQIIEWKNKLKKAEASLEKEIASGSDDDWQKQRVVESKRKTVDECLEMIRGFEAELNSLK